MFLGVIAVTRYSSLGSLVGSAAAACCSPVATGGTALDPWLYVYAVGGAALVWLFHWDNIGRLLRGQERKIGTPRTRPEEPDRPDGADAASSGLSAIASPSPHAISARASIGAASSSAPSAVSRTRWPARDRRLHDDRIDLASIGAAVPGPGSRA